MFRRLQFFDISKPPFFPASDRTAVTPTYADYLRERKEYKAEHEKNFSRCLIELKKETLEIPGKNNLYPMLSRKLNVWENVVLAELKDVTADMLIAQNANDTAFTEQHKFALTYLIGELQINPQVALNEIKNLDSYQASAIAKGFSREEVLALNKWQVTALTRLKGYITAGMLLDFTKKNNNLFTADHVCALKYLIVKRKYGTDYALNTILNLTQEQLQGILKGKSREEVLTPLKETLKIRL